MQNCQNYEKRQNCQNYQKSQTCQNYQKSQKCQKCQNDQNLLNCQVDFDPTGIFKFNVQSLSACAYTKYTSIYHLNVKLI